MPLINGTEKGKVVFLVQGVTAAANQLGTVITCTSLEKSKELIVAVEVFAEEPPDVINDITAGQGVVDNVIPGETILFEIATDGAITATNSDSSISTTSNLIHGSARVVSTGKNLMCTAAVLDSEGDPPVSMLNLSIVAKKQKGD